MTTQLVITPAHKRYEQPKPSSKPSVAIEAYLSTVFDTFFFLKPHILLHELAFRPHDASESAHRNLIFFKPLYTRGWGRRPQESARVKLVKKIRDFQNGQIRVGKA